MADVIASDANTLSKSRPREETEYKEDFCFGLSPSCDLKAGNNRFERPKTHEDEAGRKIVFQSQLTNEPGPKHKEQPTAL